MDTSSRRIRQGGKNMRKTRVVIYLEEEQRETLEWHKGASVSEVGRRAISEFLARRIGDRNRLYNPNNPPGRKPRWMTSKLNEECG